MREQLGADAREGRQATKIGGRERTSGHPPRGEAIGNGGIDVLRARDARLQHVEAFTKDSELDAIPDEAGDVTPDDKGCLSDGRSEVDKGIGSRRSSLGARDHLDDPGEVGGLEEVKAGEALGCAQPGCERADLQARRVRQEERLRRQPRFDGRVEGVLRREVLRDRLHNDVGRGEGTLRDGVTLNDVSAQSDRPCHSIGRAAGVAAKDGHLESGGREGSRNFGPHGAGPDDDHLCAHVRRIVLRGTTLTRRKVPARPPHPADVPGRSSVVTHRGAEPPTGFQGAAVQGGPVRHLSFRLIAAFAASSAFPTLATAAVSVSAVTAPADLTFASYDADALVIPTMTFSGTSDGAAGVDQVQLRCYTDSALGVSSNDVGAPVTVAAGGAWGVTLPLSVVGSGMPCRFRAVPAGYAGVPLSFGGPRVLVGGISSSAIFGGPNAGVKYNFSVSAPQLRGFADYRSVGRGGLYDTNTLGGPNLSSSQTLFYANNELLRANFANTRSQAQVDGQNAYASNAAHDLFGTASNLTGFPALTASAVFALDGGVTITESEPFARCNTNTFPATAVSCTSFQPTNVRLSRVIVQDREGLRATITDTWTSTDGAAHQLDLLVEDDVQDVSTGATQRASFLFPWAGNTFQLFASAATVGAAPGPATIGVRLSANAVDGDANFPRGAITFDTQPSGVTFNSTGTKFESAVTRTVPAGGSLVMKRIYEWGNQSADLAAQTVLSFDPIGVPVVTVSSPAAGATVTNPNLIVTGTAKDNVAVASLTVNGKAVAVQADGSWAYPVVLTAGANTITVVAKDAAGGTTSATATVTYTAPVVPIVAPPADKIVCTTPKVVGLTLVKATAALAANHCGVGRVTKVKNRRKAGKIIGQLVPAGWSSTDGTRIPLVLATAPKVKKK